MLVALTCMTLMTTTCKAGSTPGYSQIHVVITACNISFSTLKIHPHYHQVMSFLQTEEFSFLPHLCTAETPTSKTGSFVGLWGKTSVFCALQVDYFQFSSVPGLCAFWDVFTFTIFLTLLQTAPDSLAQ